MKANYAKSAGILFFIGAICTCSSIIPAIYMGISKNNLWLEIFQFAGIFLISVSCLTFSGLALANYHKETSSSSGVYGRIDRWQMRLAAAAPGLLGIMAGFTVVSEIIGFFGYEFTEVFFHIYRWGMMGLSFFTFFSLANWLMWTFVAERDRKKRKA